ncbi:MAG: hypothetical protein ACRDWI_06010 [Jiangellaceae bacterium]
MTDDTLLDELRILGREVEAGPADTDLLARAVLDRLPAERPRPADTLRRRRAVVAAAAAVMLVLVLTPPVRAAVADWLGIGGVSVLPGPEVTSAPAPDVQSRLTLDQARELVAFEPVLPELLGPPDAVDVSPDHRLLSLGWSADPGPVRLDAFDGPHFVKSVTDNPERIDLGGGTTALWFADTHGLSTVDEDGRERPDARPAGPTLVWQVDGVTLRLEGPDRDNAVEIASATVAGTR